MLPQCVREGGGAWSEAIVLLDESEAHGLPFDDSLAASAAELVKLASAAGARGASEAVVNLKRRRDAARRRSRGAVADEGAELGA